MALLNPYLHFNGNAEEAFNFYRSVFGGDFQMVMRYKDMPEEHRGDPSQENLIMHIALPIGKSSLLMGGDVPESMGKAVTGSNVDISITADSKAEADKLYNGLTAGGKAIMPMADAFWGSYFGMTTDKYGFNWMISFDTSGQQ